MRCDDGEVNRPVVLRRRFGPHLTHDKLEISKNSSAPQSDGVLKGMVNGWHRRTSMYIKINNVTGTLCLLTTNCSVSVAMVNNVLPFFYPQCFMRRDDVMTQMSKKNQKKQQQPIPEIKQLNSFKRFLYKILFLF